MKPPYEGTNSPLLNLIKPGLATGHYIIRNKSLQETCIRLDFEFHENAQGHGEYFLPLIYAAIWDDSKLKSYLPNMGGRILDLLQDLLCDSNIRDPMQRQLIKLAVLLGTIVQYCGETAVVEGLVPARHQGYPWELKLVVPNARKTFRSVGTLSQLLECVK